MGFKYMVPVIGLEPTTPSLRRIALCIIYNNLQQKSSGLPRFLLFFYDFLDFAQKQIVGNFQVFFIF